MKRRDGSRPRHPDAHYARCELPGGLNGEHHFRIPSPLQASRLLSMAATDDDDGAHNMRKMGALIGSAWHHEHLDLVATAGRDLDAYGEAVFEELHAAGYRLEVMMLLSQIITVEIGKISAISAEVRARLGFSVPTTDGSGPINSDSATSISAHPSPSTA